MPSRVDAAFAAGQIAWPTVRLDPQAFAAHVASHDPNGADTPLEHAADLYLACACVHGIPEAVRAFDEILTSGVARAIARIETNAAFVDDVTQTLREKLLLGAPPKIAEFGGRAMLRNWLATAAVRTALNMRRRKDDVARASLASSLGPRVVHGPEVEYLRARYRDVFEAGLGATLATLTERERTLLRMNLVERVTLERLATVYGAGRSTVARWVVAAKDKLLAGTRAHLVKTLGLSSSEYESLAAQLRSDVDVSLFRMLKEAPGA